MSAVAAPDDVLSVRGLNVTVRDTVLVADVDLTVGPGERVGLIGESGSGKSLTALSILGLLPDDVVADGSIRLAGVGPDLVGTDEKTLSRIRGRDLAMVFQEPMTALNPTMRIGDQIAEVMLIHQTRSGRAAARAAAAELLERVQLPPDLLRAYPHQLSGGQRQRVVLAIALANDPALLICDEPTTALDVTVQALVLDLIVSGVRERSSALLFITHDLAVVATVCDRVLVMYGGRVVESGPITTLFTTPRHRYTQGLLAASNLEPHDAPTASDFADGAYPDSGSGDVAPSSRTRSRRLTTIPGTVPAAGHFPSGCVFRNRCAHATDVCATTPPWTGTATHGYACHHPAGAQDA
ncbi:ABC transporter ATP-binding protein [Kribbella sandramycini]|uniref:ABC transporter ATP-binding protein n=1 Tax=Kribbella sandramycini TaxID=60450 RepID=A0A7Y4L6K9_9ACTN|nr:ABC transporter ATP-binding protein [Kribbella sandramycini]MBB6570464.1 oligopeptide/dipeptide ABC transporter ATP-binding protein [Kribbella sandramycini]NOL45324.1 ABC transporter ATP-binding protein [Kribbella sandramycini]